MKYDRMKNSEKNIEHGWTMVNPQPFPTVAKWLISAPQQSLWIKPTGCIVIWQTLPKQTFITCNILLVLVRMLLTTGTSERVEDLQLSASFQRQWRDWKGLKCLVKKTETMKSETKVFPHVLSLMDWHEWYNQRKWQCSSSERLRWSQLLQLCSSICRHAIHTRPQEPRQVNRHGFRCLESSHLSWTLHQELQNLLKSLKLQLLHLPEVSLFYWDKQFRSRTIAAVFIGFMMSVLCHTACTT